MRRGDPGRLFLAEITPRRRRNSSSQRDNGSNTTTTTEATTFHIIQAKIVKWTSPCKKYDRRQYLISSGVDVVGGEAVFRETKLRVLMPIHLTVGQAENAKPHRNQKSKLQIDIIDSNVYKMLAPVWPQPYDLNPHIRTKPRNGGGAGI